MRVAIIGNLCNLGYLTMLSLRAHSIDVVLFISGNELGNINDPRRENMNCFLEDKIIFWESNPNLNREDTDLVRTYSAYKLPNNNKMAILRCAAYINKNYDFVIGVTLGSIIALLSRKKFIWFATGSDLREWIFRRNKLSSWILRIVAKKAISILSSDDAGCRIAAAKLRVVHKLIATRDFPVNIDLLHSALKKYSRQIDNKCLTIINPANQIWSVKGNDKLIHAFAKFLQEGDKNVKMILLRRGEDFCKSKTLVEDLGIGDCIIWKDTMDKETLNKEMVLADVIADQFILGDIGGIAREACCLGKPVLAYLEDKNDERPIINCYTVDDIKCAMQKCLDISYRREVGKRAMEYADDNYSFKKFGALLIEAMER